MLSFFQSLVILREVTSERLCKCLGADNAHEEMSMAALHLIQSIVDALQGEDKLDHRGKDTALRAGTFFVSYFCEFHKYFGATSF